MSNLCFQRELRLVTPHHYKFVFDSPVKAASPNLTILARANSLDHMRLGLVVPKKVLSHAVDRNRVKRLARAFFRLNQHNLPCLDYVFIAKGKIGDMDNASIVQLTQKLCTVISRRCKK